MVVQGGFLEFSSLLRGRKIAPFCNCITTVAYLSRSGGTRSHTPGGGPGPSLPVASDHSPVRYTAVSKAPCVLCYSVAFLQPWDYLRTYAFPPITLITSVLLKLRASHTCDLTLIAPLLASREWSPALLDLPPDTPMELPERRDLLRQPHFHRFQDDLPFLCLTAWLLSSDSPVRQTSLRQWLAILPSVGDILD